ncbi:MAG TPA: DUF402 domain-containing protein [Acidimicrobiales bacterium]|nr:DUF402 domain-containing protein [Acidimicrobiales bacterium]
MAESRRWEPGEIIVRREVLGLSPIEEAGSPPSFAGTSWFACPVHVVEDSEEQLVTFISPGAEFAFPDGDWPTPDGRHPWGGRSAWVGHGCLMVQRPGEHHAIWHLWEGPDRSLACWYVNLQTAFRRTALGYDTQDLELDIVVLPDGTWSFKDLEVLDDRVAEGRYSGELVEWVVALGNQLGARLDAGERWWDPTWASWTPDPAWADAPLPEGWATGG